MSGHTAIGFLMYYGHILFLSGMISAMTVFGWLYCSPCLCGDFFKKISLLSGSELILNLVSRDTGWVVF